MNMEILENQLQIGQVKTIRSNGGKTVDFVELLFSPNTKASFCIDKKNNTLEFVINNVDLKYQDLNCSLEKSTLRDLIVNLKDLYNELEETK